MAASRTDERAGLLGTENVFKLILQYAIPAVAMMLISALYNIVDKIFVGNLVGQAAIAATTLANPAFRGLDGFAMLVGAGGSTLLAIRMGEKRSDEAEHILNNSFVFITILGIGCSVLLYFFRVQFLTVCGAEDSVMPLADTYLSIALIGAYPNALSSGFGLFVRTDGSPRRMMFCSMAGCVINIILDPIMIYCFGMGIAGAALATTIAQFVSGGMVIHYFTMSKRSTIKLRISLMRLKWETTKRTAILGFSSFIAQLTGAVAGAVMTSCLAFFATSETVSAAVAQASVGITVSVGLIFVMPAVGIATAIQPIIGYNYGAKNYSRVIETLKKGVLLGVCVLSCGWIIIQLFSPYLCMIFGSEGANLEHAARTLRIYNLLLPVVPFSNIGSAFFQSVNQPRKAVLLSLSRQVISQIPAMIILSIIFGQNGVFYAMPVSDGISASICITLMILQCRRFRSMEREL